MIILKEYSTNQFSDLLKMNQLHIEIQFMKQTSNSIEMNMDRTSAILIFDKPKLILQNIIKKIFLLGLQINKEYSFKVYYIHFYTSQFFKCRSFGQNSSYFSICFLMSRLYKYINIENYSTQLFSSKCQKVKQFQDFAQE
ncbi:hypothetical protein pb186bvf_003190 [Paramecium bursaria]